MRRDLDLFKEIGERIRNIRNSLKMNKEELAKKLGVTGQFLGVVENGQSSMGYDKLKKLCEISGCSADYILFGRNANVVKETKDILSEYNQEEIEEICDVIKNIAVMIKKKDEDNLIKSDDKIC